jgi:para-nitrobenzyl esterase
MNSTPRIPVPRPLHRCARRLNAAFQRQSPGGNAATMTARRLTLSAAYIACALLTACGTPPTGSATTPSGTRLTDVIATTGGPIQGLHAALEDEYLGIPYAAPPVGKLRWRPPQAPLRLQSTLRTTHFAPTCAQAPRGAFASPSEAEDCLYLNVFVPRDAATDHVTLRPVMLWIHGGGLFSGESNDYDASALVRAGAIVVTVNYRIGALGFLSQPALNAEGHAYANYGLMDQQAALHWVQANIAAFGGDSHKVTIFGQSGGATSVLAQLASPAAAGLFQRAIVQSGTRIAPYTQHEALAAGEAFAAAAGCPDQSAQCLRALDVQQILRHQTAIAAYIGTRFPVVDGTIVTRTAQQAFERGEFNRVPVVNGLVADEQAFFMPEIMTGAPPLGADGYERFLQTFGATRSASLHAAYPLASYASPSEAEIAATQDLKICTARYLDRNWANYVPVYAYQFEDRDAPSYFGPVSYPMRAYHTAELQYLFPRFHGGAGTAHPLDAAQQALAQRMVADWTRFAASGAPPATWPRYSAASDSIERLDTRAPAVTAAYGIGHHCDLWEPVVLGAAH